MKYLNNSHVLASWSSGVAFFILSVIELVEIGWNIIGLIYKHRYILGLIAAPRNVFAISSAVLLGLRLAFTLATPARGGENEMWILKNYSDLLVYVIGHTSQATGGFKSLTSVRFTKQILH